MSPGLLLSADDPQPAIITNPHGASAILLVGDHAGRAVPAKLGDLGVRPGDMDQHIAWDIGIAGLGAKLSALLDATFIHQAYSRLVIDCNRRPDAADAAPAISDGVTIPANLGLSRRDRRRARRAGWTPDADRVAAQLYAGHGGLRAALALRRAASGGF